MANARPSAHHLFNALTAHYSALVVFQNNLLPAYGNVGQQKVYMEACKGNGLKFGVLFILLSVAGCNQEEIKGLQHENTLLKARNDSLRMTLEVRDQDPLLRFQKALEIEKRDGEKAFEMYQSIVVDSNISDFWKYQAASKMGVYQSIEKQHALQEQLRGEWIWYKDLNGLMSHPVFQEINNPEKCGCTKSLKIGSDTLQILKNGRVERETAYAVGQSIQFFESEIPLLEYKDNQVVKAFALENEGRTLVLKDVNCIINCERSQYFYKKNWRQLKEFSGK